MSRSEPIDSFIPARVGFDDSVVALLFVLAAPAGLVSRLSTYTSKPKVVRRWLSDWLGQRSREWEMRDDTETYVSASFIVVTVRRESNSDELCLGEFTYGEYPAAPDDWQRVPVLALIAHALETLT
jgi:hypothetical protein